MSRLRSLKKGWTQSFRQTRFQKGEFGKKSKWNVSAPYAVKRGGGRTFKRGQKGAGNLSTKGVERKPKEAEIQDERYNQG